MDYIYLLTYKLFALIATLLPLVVLNKILLLLSRLLYKFDKKHAHIIDANLSIAYGDTLSDEEKNHIGVNTFYNLFQTVIGFMKRKDKTQEQILRTLTFQNEHYLQDALQDNRKIIFITAHYGNWELIPPALTSRYDIELSIVGRKLDSKVMDNILKANRERFNVDMIYRKGAIKNAVTALKNNRPLGLLIDQHLGPKQGGIEVSFFGQSVYQSPAASILARMTNAVVIPVFMTTNDYQNYQLTFYAPLKTIKTENKEADILMMTQDQSNIVEHVIRRKPDEWFWVHKRWKGFYPEIY